MTFQNQREGGLSRSGCDKKKIPWQHTVKYNIASWIKLDPFSLNLEKEPGAVCYQTPRDQAIAKEEQELFMAQIQSALTEREFKVLYGYFWEELQFVQISRLFGVSPERIRQLCAKALRKLRKWFFQHYDQIGFVSDYRINAQRREEPVPEKKKNAQKVVDTLKAAKEKKRKEWQEAKQRKKKEIDERPLISSHKVYEQYNERLREMDEERQLQKEIQERVSQSMLKQTNELDMARHPLPNPDLAFRELMRHCEKFSCDPLETLMKLQWPHQSEIMTKLILLREVSYA